METRRYELLMLAVPEITQDEAKELERQVDTVIRAHKGATLSFERWGKFRLAYPVKKNDYGVYFLTRFETANSDASVQETRTLFTIKLHHIIMRSMFTVLDSTQSLEYQRPKSLEELPSRDVDSFLNEGKMEGNMLHSREEEL
ncbi:MAG TPA: 30S ribosomal protein S6 [Candidatus Bathyarchaeia archaeon]|nr:30S ribosomal protein S6 [Candidatus Bathyarchaeia archaeon]